MKNWIRGFMIAVLAISVGLGSVNASPVFEDSNRIENPVVLNEQFPSMGIEDSFVFKPGRSGGSFSSRPSSSSSRPSSPSPSRSSGGWGSSSSKPSTPSVAPSTSSKSSGSWFGGSSKTSPSTSKPVTPTNKTAGSVDSKINSSTKSTGKTYSSKESAVAAFKASNAKETAPGGKFTSHYKTEPSTRPSHIPTTYNNHTVVYNPSYGGYGYWSGGGPGLGTWMMYDMMRDAAMISAMSHNHGYYAPGGGAVYVGGGNYILSTVVTIIVLIIIVLIIVKVFNKND